jgi:hypothetical protein
VREKERIKVQTIRFLNRPSQNEKSANYIRKSSIVWGELESKPNCHFISNPKTCMRFCDKIENILWSK